MTSATRAAASLMRRPGVEFRVLVVCTANQCRSPMAEFLLRQEAATLGVRWKVFSAGTHAVPRLPMHPNTQRVLNSRGIAVGDWQTTCLDDDLLERTDLVLTAAREHSSFLTMVRPALLGRVFPLLRFARLAEAAQNSGQWSPGASDPSVQLAQLAGIRIPGPKGSEDIEDPVGHHYRRFKACASTIDDAIEMIFGPVSGMREP